MERLYRAASSCRCHHQLINRTGFNSAIGVDEHNDLGRIQTEMSKGKVESVALAEFRFIMALNDFGASCPRDSRGVICAIICNNNQSVSRKQLTLDVSKRWQKSCAFIMCGHQNGEARANTASRSDNNFRLRTYNRGDDL